MLTLALTSLMPLIKIVLLFVIVLFKGSIRINRMLVSRITFNVVVFIFPKLSTATTFSVLFPSVKFKAREKIPFETLTKNPFMLTFFAFVIPSTTIVLLFVMLLFKEFVTFKNNCCFVIIFMLSLTALAFPALSVAIIPTVKFPVSE